MGQKTGVRNERLRHQVYFRQNRSQHHAEEIKLKAQRKAGEFLEKLGKGHGGPPSKMSSQAAKSLSPFRQACEESGIGKDDAWRYQQVAAVPMR